MNEEVEKHLIQVRINEELVSLLKTYKLRCYYKWIFVSVYHAALHYFYAFLVYHGKTPPKRHLSKNKYSVSDSELGDVELAKNCYFTQKNKIDDGIGSEYGQLYGWSCDVRYRPKKSKLLSGRELDTAFLILDRCKLITFNDVGYYTDICKWPAIKTKTIGKNQIRALYDRNLKRLKISK